MKLGKLLDGEYLVDSIVIISHVLSKDKSWVLSNLNEDINEEVSVRILNLIEKRKNGMPLAYIIKKKEFMGLDFYVEEGVFIPRAETETLVEYALRFIDENKMKTVAEIGCGSGAISISLAKFAGVKVFCSDISAKAVKITKKNSVRLQTEELVMPELGEFLVPFEDNLDSIEFIISNPPYVDRSYKLPKEVTYEPKEALFYGETSLDFYIEFSKKYKGIGKPVMMEFSGFEKDKAAIKELFDDVYFLKDLDGMERFFIGLV